jgi:PAS domain S-box-containing protein
MKTKSELLQQIEYLENRIIEAEEMIDAIKNDKIDALVINTSKGDQIYTLQGAERPYRIFLEQMNEGAITLSVEGIILYCNNKFAELLTTPMETIIGSAIFRWIAQGALEKFSSFLMMSNGNAKAEIDFIRSDKTQISLYLSLKRIPVENSDPIFCIVATDLTEKKKNEEIVAAEKLARSILEQAADAIVVCDDNFRIIRASQAAESLVGKNIFNNHFDDVFSLTDSEMNPLPLRELITSKDKLQDENVIFTRGKNKFNLIISIGILTGPSNKTIGYVINLTNITKHIEAEEKLSQSLREKTVLLKEIHHRVKNNLQVISSLLRLQSINVAEGPLLNILNECQNRITSMALIHQKLYESESFARVNISSYLQELVSYLCSTYMFNSKNIKLNIPQKDFAFSIDAAVPVGLIVNEVVSNSFKHAFPQNSKGIVDIDFHSKSDKCFTLKIKDNGKGFPDNYDFFSPETLGLQLVHTLIDQLNGTIKLVTSEKGSEIIMNIDLEDQ